MSSKLKTTLKMKTTSKLKTTQNWRQSQIWRWPQKQRQPQKWRRPQKRRWPKKWRLPQQWRQPQKWRCPQKWGSRSVCPPKITKLYKTSKDIEIRSFCPPFIYEDRQWSLKCMPSFFLKKSQKEDFLGS